MPALVEMVGQRFGRLLVTERGPNNHVGHVCWWAQCNCGNRKLTAAGHLRSGAVRSCGCLHKAKLAERNATHGHSVRSNVSRTYGTWAGMIARCTYPKHIGWPHYGGRGIKVCERWMVFENFLVDMGERPEGRTIDRIDVNGNYEPGNCRWATRLEQAANRRKLPIDRERVDRTTLATWRTRWETQVWAAAAAPAST
jgi:hypothetical protein